MSVYEKIVTYRAKVGSGILFSKAAFHKPSQKWFIDVEDERKNGQEDTHAYGTLIFNIATNQWEWADEDGAKKFDLYADGAEPILEFINANPPPGFKP